MSPTINNIYFNGYFSNLDIEKSERKHACVDKKTGNLTKLQMDLYRRMVEVGNQQYLKI